LSFESIIMLIALNASAAFKEPRTGVEEYTYQLIKHLTLLKENRKHRFILYVNPALRKKLDFSLPKNFSLKPLKWFGPAWTQIRLAAELFSTKIDVLFIPVHILPLIHPQKSVVVIHGLEYEYYPKMYPGWFRKYLAWSTKYALSRARKIIAVSENTKKDLIKLYQGKPEKIEVVYHGIEKSNFKSQKSKFKKKSKSQIKSQNFKYILCLGRIELKKNILGVVEAFDILKEKYNLPHWLILAGPIGFGYQKIKERIQKSKFKKQIIETGYLTETEKQKFLSQADIFLFPSFYEGFGLPILEAQVQGVPIVTSNLSSMPEIAGQGAVLIDPHKPSEIAEAVYLIAQSKKIQEELIEKGFQNVKRFSWLKCARETLKVLENLL